MGAIAKMMLGCLAWAGVMAVSEGAEACSCAAAQVSLALIPGDGARDFPVDGVIRIFVTGGVPATVMARLHEEFRLRGADGALVPLDAEQLGTLISLKPSRPLLPSTQYTVERIYAYSQDGLRLSEDVRLGHGGVIRETRSRPTTRRRVWYPAVSFSTGAGPAAAELSAPTITAATGRYYGSGWSCGETSSMELVLAGPAPRPYELWALELEGKGIVRYFPGEMRVLAGDKGGCASDPLEIPRAEPWRARVRLVSAAGALGPSSPWSPVIVERHDTEVRPETEIDPAIAAEWAKAALERDRATAACFFATPATEPQGRQESGPSTCPYGLEVRRTIELPIGAMPEDRWSVRSMGRAGAQDHVVHFDPRTGRAQVLSIDERGAVSSAPIEPEGPAVVAAFDDRGMITAVVGLDGGLLVTRHDARGDRSWRQIVKNGPIAHPQLEWGADRALVVWSLENKIQGLLLDANTGAALGVVDGPRGASPIAALAFDGKDFLIAWRESKRTTVARIDPHGAIVGRRNVRGAQGHALDLACVAQRCWLAFDTVDGLEVAPLGTSVGRSHLIARPSELDDVILTGQGDTMFIAWSSIRLRSSAHVTAFDAGGHVAPPFPLAQDKNLWRPMIAATDEGIIASYRIEPNRQSTLVRLGCRETPMLRAPLYLPALR